MENKDKFKWLRWNGHTISSYTGPTGDHITGDENGKRLFRSCILKGIAFKSLDFVEVPGSFDCLLPHHYLTLLKSQVLYIDDLPLPDDQTLSVF